MNFMNKKNLLNYSLVRQKEGRNEQNKASNWSKNIIFH